MKIQFCGAASGVTGSCHLITTKNHKILLDCGQFQGGKAMDAMNFEPFPFNPAEIDYVILSHAHIDHCGRIPLLVKRGFRGDIYCTDATADLVDVMLKDSGYIHEKEAEWKNRKAERSGKALVEPLYTYNDALDSLQYIKPVLYDQLVELNDEMRIVFNDAGHILGSAITELWIKEDGRESKIVFSGDLGVMERPILRNPTLIKKADYVIMESTYGNRLHVKNSTSVNQLMEIVMKTIKRGGTAVIPSFAVGRTQELIFEFNRYYESHPEMRSFLDGLMVYVDSPMATTATEVFRRNAQVFDDETKAYILRGDNPLDFKNLKFTRTTTESQMLNIDANPKVIISASGMCEAGRIRHHLKHNLWNPKSSVIFVGYQAEGTLGRLLVEGAKEVTLFGEDIHVNAEIYNLEGFSGHADMNGLVSWLAGFRVRPKEIFLVHGEQESKHDLAKTIKKELGLDATVVEGVSEYDLENDTVVNRQEAQQQGVDQEELYDVKKRIAGVHYDLEKILYNTQLAMGEEVSPARMAEIKNIVLQLEKMSINLGSAVTKKDDPEEMAESQMNQARQSLEGKQATESGRMPIAQAAYQAAKNGGSLGSMGGGSYEDIYGGGYSQHGRVDDPYAAGAMEPAKQGGAFNGDLSNAAKALKVAIQDKPSAREYLDVMEVHQKAEGERADTGFTPSLSGIRKEDGELSLAAKALGVAIQDKPSNKEYFELVEGRALQAEEREREAAKRQARETKMARGQGGGEEPNLDSAADALKSAISGKK